MLRQPKRKLTDVERDEIMDLWAEYRALGRVAQFSLSPDAAGSWIFVSAERRRKEIADRLDVLFAETAP